MGDGGQDTHLIYWHIAHVIAANGQGEVKGNSYKAIQRV